MGKEFLSNKIIFLCLHKKIYKKCGHKTTMVSTEIREINGKKYYYRVNSIRNGKKVSLFKNNLFITTTFLFLVFFMEHRVVV